MTTIKNENGHKGSIDFHAEVPVTVAPKVKAEKVIKGVRYYFTENGKQFIADMYDKAFKCVKMKMKGRYSKGDLIGNAAIYAD